MENNSLTKIVLHGRLGKDVGRKTWNLKVDSISEGLRAIDILSKRKFTKTILANEKRNVKYKVLVNNKDAISKSIETAEDAIDSELFIERKGMEKIDIVPVIEGAGGDTKDTLMVVGGALMFGMGLYMGSSMMVQLGLFAMLSGMANLLAEPPEFEDFREIQQVNKRESYLFNGPINTYNPGGPIPIGYGRILCGSLAIAFSQTSADHKIYDGTSYYP